MTLDEAIKRCEEVVDMCEYEAGKYDLSDPYESHVACQEGKCCEGHRQLAEWLKDYKRLLAQEPCDDVVSRQWLMECVNEGWIKFDTEKDKNRFIHLVRDIAPPVTPQDPTDKSNLEKICEELAAENDDLRDQLAMRDRDRVIVRS